MYVLHYAPDNASLIVRLVLEEMGQPYRTVLVDRSAAEQRGKTYRALNPTALIPTLETPEGPIFETAAIILWLSERHQMMAPAPGSAARAPFLKHLFFVSNTLHASLRLMFYPDQYVGADESAQRILRAHVQRHGVSEMTLPNALGLMDRYYRAELPISAQRNPSVLDYYIAAAVRWCGIYPASATDWFNLGDYPALAALLQWLEGRPAVQAAAKAEGLGDRPFTAPKPPCPPEGSPT